jgi:hypothetical protein
MGINFANGTLAVTLAARFRKISRNQSKKLVPADFFSGPDGVRARDLPPMVKSRKIIRIEQILYVGTVVVDIFAPKSQLIY